MGGRHLALAYFLLFSLRGATCASSYRHLFFFRSSFSGDDNMLAVTQDRSRHFSFSTRFSLRGAFAPCRINIWFASSFGWWQVIAYRHSSYRHMVSFWLFTFRQMRIHRWWCAGLVPCTKERILGAISRAPTHATGWWPCASTHSHDFASSWHVSARRIDFDFPGSGVTTKWWSPTFLVFGINSNNSNNNRQ